MAQHQTYDERRQQILQGALQAFSEKGYLGASNKDIAQAAHSAPSGQGRAIRRRVSRSTLA